ncbi:sulfurtransferase complex subunit TusD [Cellvibrio mixtus]|uniref:sulfurtransferase complex subunit TusD n=1 Tax=Cellvibrio mixtus TaxID=39650 RepID=UPI000B25E468|nr:sulfurtransferase complex subunit TusD [Cellvibrio mixtus]
MIVPVMIFSINVQSPPSSQASYSAYQFCRALLRQGHNLHRVFFYQDGIYNATNLAAPPQDELDLYSEWQKLSKEHSVELVVCIAAALKRGLLNQEESIRYNKAGHNLAEGFTLGGLGQLIEAAAVSDRLITFGN